MIQFSPLPQVVVLRLFNGTPGILAELWNPETHLICLGGTLNEIWRELKAQGYQYKGRTRGCWEKVDARENV